MIPLSTAVSSCDDTLLGVPSDRYYCCKTYWCSLVNEMKRSTDLKGNRKLFISTEGRKSAKIFRKMIIFFHITARGRYFDGNDSRNRERCCPT